jgi:hypothetical protein
MYGIIKDICFIILLLNNNYLSSNEHYDLKSREHLVLQVTRLIV